MRSTCDIYQAPTLDNRAALINLNECMHATRHPRAPHSEEAQ